MGSKVFLYVVPVIMGKELFGRARFPSNLLSHSHPESIVSAMPGRSCNLTGAWLIIDLMG